VNKVKSAPDAFEVDHLTEHERTVINKQQKQWSARTVTPRLKIENGTWKLGYIDWNIGAALLMETLGTIDHEFMEGLLDQLCQLANNKGKILERDFRFILAVVQGIEPRDQIETMHAAQMAAIHLTMMKIVPQVSSSKWLAQQEHNVRAINKLAGTFAMQMQAIKRYRTGGEQKVTVQHVSVSDGGQAIVGNVTQTATTAKEKAAKAKPVLALTDASGTAMPPVRARERATVPVRRRQRHDREASA
jgi:hypothetical protein